MYVRVVSRRLSEQPATVCLIVTSARQCGVVPMRHLVPRGSNEAIIFAAQCIVRRDTWTIRAGDVQLLPAHRLPRRSPYRRR